MSSSPTTNLALSVGLLLGLRWVPRDIKVPDDYLISGYVARNLPKNKKLIEIGTREPTGWTDVRWPLDRFLGTMADLFHYGVDEPLVALAVGVEQIVRGTSNSTVQEAEKTVLALAEQNKVYDEQLQLLKPVAEKIVEVLDMAEKLNTQTSQNLKIEEEIVSKIQQDAQEILEARKQIDFNKIQEAAHKVATFVQETLSNPDFINRLKMDYQRLNSAIEKLEKAKLRLQEAQKEHEIKTAKLKQLWEEYEKLGKAVTQNVENYKKLAELKVNRIINSEKTHEFTTCQVSST